MVCVLFFIFFTVTLQNKTKKNNQGSNKDSMKLHIRGDDMGSKW